MKTSVEWLSQFVEIPWEPRELSQRLTGAGLEVEGIESQGQIPEGVVTARILTRQPHPDSDHMSVCTVDIGNGEPIQVVCGAPNCDAGKIAPFATIGTKFADFKIKKSKLRGVESNGMLCSRRELGISAEHDGIMILPDDTPLGLPMASLVQGDTVIDWEVTPNRPDWNSHFGIAREIGAVSGNPIKMPEMPIVEDASEQASSIASVTISAPDLCPRYIARVFKDVKIGPSPDWLVRRLEAVGLRTINNVVDITNYVMLEFGNPLHAFDLRTLHGSRINVRRAEDGERIRLLDGTELTLSHDNLLIADADHGVALAGIMGGENSMITDDTTTVLLEAATFDRSNIRISSRTLGKATDSSYRYERGVSPYLTELASQRAASLLCELCGAVQLQGAIDVYPRPWQCAEIPLDYTRCNERLGLQLTAAQIEQCLQQRGLTKLSGNECGGVFQAPPWRFDLAAEHDLFEEVAQMTGMDNIPEAPAAARIGGHIKDDKFIPLETARADFNALGLDEIINYSMWSPQQCLAGTDYTEEQILRVSNPISGDTACLRPTLLPGLLAVVGHNVARSEHDLNIFEVGRVFLNNGGKYEERTMAAVALTGHPWPERYGADLARVCDFYDMKGLVEDWLERRGLRNLKWEPYEGPAYRKGAAAVLKLGGRTLVTFGEANALLTKGFRMRHPLIIAQFELDALMGMSKKAVKYTALPQYPATSRDVSFVAPAGLTHQQIVSLIEKLHLPGLEKVAIFDIFENEKVLGKGRRSFAYNITFRNPDRTITDDEGNALQEKIRQALAALPGVELR